MVCQELSEYQCSIAPPEDAWGGCTYKKDSNVEDSVILALTSISLFLLFVTVFLLAKIIRANKREETATADGEEAGGATEPLLSGTDA